MKKLMYLFLMVLTIGFFSCQKEKDFKKDKHDKKCFEIVYPFSVLVDDAEGATIINSEEELKAIYISCEEIAASVEAQDDFDESDKDGYFDKNECFEYVFPLMISYGKSETKTIANPEELMLAYETCKGKKDHFCGDEESENNE